MIARPILAAILALAAPLPVAAQTELAYQEKLCFGMPQNRYLPSGTEVDCISDTHAIEVDFSAKWAEAIGQALHYAAELRKRPGIILICKARTQETTCLKHRYLIEGTMAYWRIGMTMWLCGADAARLGDCMMIELGDVE